MLIATLNGSTTDEATQESVKTIRRKMIPQGRKPNITYATARCIMIGDSIFHLHAVITTFSHVLKGSV